MKTSQHRFIALLLSVILTLAAVAGCSSEPAKTTAEPSSTAASADVTASPDPTKEVSSAGTTAEGTSSAPSTEPAAPARKIIIGFMNVKPTTYIEDNGNITGNDIEALRLIDELLPEYEFEYEFSESIWPALQSGKIQAATNNTFWTQNRAETYLFPKEYLGVNDLGIITNIKFTDVHSIDDAAEQGLRLAPSMAGNGTTYIIEKYNIEHPDKQIDIPLTDNGDVFRGFPQTIADGRADFICMPKQTWVAQVEAEDAPNHDLIDKLRFEEYGVVETWVAFGKDEQELADAFDRAVVQLKKDGTLRRLTIEFSGVDSWRWVDDAAK